MQSTKGWLDFLKIRASYGLVGNDKYSGARFLYLNGSWNPSDAVFDWGYYDAAGNVYKGSWQFGDQYSPVLQPGARSREVYLPAGSWRDADTGEVLSGGRTVTVAAPLERIPVFERA